MSSSEPTDDDLVEDDIASAARVRTPVLITSVDRRHRKRLAQAIHARGTHRLGPFVEVICGALRQPSMESDLFADIAQEPHSQPPQIIVKAQGGTLFLDEIEKLSQSGQAMMTELLERYERRSTTTWNVRFIAGTGTSLFERMLSEEFSDELFYRLNTIHIIADI